MGDGRIMELAGNISRKVNILLVITGFGIACSLLFLPLLASLLSIAALVSRAVMPVSSM